MTIVDTRINAKIFIFITSMMNFPKNNQQKKILIKKFNLKSQFTKKKVSNSSSSVVNGKCGRKERDGQRDI